MGGHYDYIIAGAGASGLSLAYHMVQAGLRDKKILLLDRAAKTTNDRTWCFWEVGQNSFERVVFRRWNQIWFHGEGVSRRFNIAPYAYKMIRGIDFYTFMSQWVLQQPNISVRYGEISHIQEGEGGAVVGLDGQTFAGQWVFNSLYKPAPKNPRHHYLLQHFKGWVIQTPEPVFDTEAATFMDFRLEQRGEVRFVYVLPFDPHTALVEYTLFSPEPLRPDDYDAGLREYLGRWLGLERYEIQESESGIIPMTDAPFARQQSPRVMNIGTAGGRTKASTGYTFLRIQKQSRRIADSLMQTGQPFYPEPVFNRHACMDSVLLNVLDSRRSPGKRIFSDLFRKNPPQRVLRFLDEETGLLEDLQIMSSVDIRTFVSAALAVGRRRWLEPKRG
ncbi:lycopene cyclase family protein [uncultured Meiothermus sp.]|uniref:lycopene cyclase family protein n=1 Tax=uncultured Meiothermus sp. TaxID=157471 RepID=UPI002625BDEF|nr:lycopene cyclase family protein [uncultured Meiothermus sp.]